MVRFAAGAQIFVCIIVSRRALEPFETSHPIGTLNKPLLLSTADIKYEWSCVSTLPYACKLLFIKNYGDIFLPDIRFVYVRQRSISFIHVYILLINLNVAIQLLLLLLQEIPNPCNTTLWAYRCAGLQLQCWQWHHCSAGEGQSTASSYIVYTCCTALLSPPFQLLSLVHPAQLCSVHHFRVYRLHILHSFVQSTISAYIACICCTALFSPPFQLISLAYSAQLCSVHHFSLYRLHILHSFFPPFQLISLAYSA
jgi:tRNA A37 threonylcarbamoyladenosine biosynthesis protein TsaE